MNAPIIDLAAKLAALTNDAIAAPPKPIEAIRQIRGMRPDHATEAIDHLEIAEAVTNDGVRNEELTKALIHSNLALVEALTRNRKTAEWAGMEGNE